MTNWLQTRLTLGAIRNFRSFYPDIPLIVVDDGSPDMDMKLYGRAYPFTDKSIFDPDIQKLRDVKEKYNFDLIELPFNIGHGASVDTALERVKTRLVLTMDHDIRIQDTTLLEEYIEKMNDDPDSIYAIGPIYTCRELGRAWVGLWFSLYQVEPIRTYQLTFNNFVVNIPIHVQRALNSSYIHLEPGLFIHDTLMSEYPNRTIKKNYRCITYPLIEKMWKQIEHLKIDVHHPKQYEKWLTMID